MILHMETAAAHPFFGGATAFVTIMAGALASFYTSEIKNNLTPFWGADSFSSHASYFWACVILAGVFFVSSQWAQTRRAARATSKLEEMINRLQTLPADGYLPSYQSCYRIAASNALAVIYSQSATLTQVEAAIRTVLGAILETARDFDRSGDTLYCANIMLWREGGVGLEAPTPIHLVQGGNGCPQFAGLLELMPNLSTSTANQAYARDSHAKPVTLPVPRDSAPVRNKNQELAYPMLPGAPWAFVNRVFASYNSIKSLFNWLDTKSSADLHTIESIKKYFRDGDGKNIRSFGSIPILLPTASAPTEDSFPIGVLNLHSAQENILKDNGQTLFAPLLEPFLILLSVLLIAREHARLHPLTPAGSNSEPQPSGSK